MKSRKKRGAFWGVGKKGRDSGREKPRDKRGGKEIDRERNIQRKRKERM